MISIRPATTKDIPIIAGLHIEGWKGAYGGIVDQEYLDSLTIEKRIADLNERVAADARLGKQFRIGHSYVTPVHRLEAGDTKKWFQQVVDTEIGPLLEEYWFDAPDEAQKATTQLTQGW